MDDQGVKVEHHFHEPTSGQVVKGVMQYLVDKLPREEIDRLVDRKITEVVEKRIAAWTGSERFEQLIVQAVAHFVQGERRVFDHKPGYGLPNRLRDLIEKELQRTLVRDYTIAVAKKEAP